MPHFEKMLFDQALLTMAYCEAWQAYRQDSYRDMVAETIEYVTGTLGDPGGGFATSQDAVSDGEEGGYYLWTLSEVRAVLPADDAAFAGRIFNLTEEGNFPDPVTGRSTGKNVLYLSDSIGVLSAAEGVDEASFHRRYTKVRRTLAKQREQRTTPFIDDTILTDANGCMIAALARAYSVFGDAAWREAADRAIARIESGSCEDGTLRHHFRADTWSVPGFLDDYAWYVYGLLEMYAATLEVQYLAHAVRHIDHMIEHFRDRKNGGYFLTSDEAEELPVRTKEFSDGAQPSGNSIVCMDLLRLARITGNRAYEDTAAGIMRDISGAALGTASAFTGVLQALLFRNAPGAEIVIAGDPEADDTKQMITLVKQMYRPDDVMLLRTPEAEAPIVEYAAYTRPLTMLQGKATAYVCRDHTCELPVTGCSELEKLLAETSRGIPAGSR
jgi:uncharacterized protein YyaL (SSP411 family)